VGPGPSEVEEVLPWDGPETAALLAGEDVGGPLARALASVDAVLAFTRAEAVLSAFRARARRLIPHDPSPPADGPHASVWLAQALAPLGVRALADPPLLAFTPSERREAERLVQGLPPAFLAVHPGSGSPAKNWPAERFLEVAGTLSGGQAWLLVRGPAEGAFPHPRGAKEARQWPLRVLGAALARAGLFLGNDSGVAHLAAAAGTPTLVLYGLTDPALWAPVGPAVATLRAPSRAVAQLGLDEVRCAALALRSGGSGPPTG
jgi:ADP-heptose:LPS heptosyltransferase